MKRPYGTGHIYEKSGAYYGRWHTPDGRRRNRRLGPKRAPGSSEGLTRAMAERALRIAQEAELAAVPPADDARDRTVDDAANALRERLELQRMRWFADRQHRPGAGGWVRRRNLRPTCSARCSAC
jgi:hypothetical protein